MRDLFYQRNNDIGFDICSSFFITANELDNIYPSENFNYQSRLLRWFCFEQRGGGTSGLILWFAWGSDFAGFKSSIANNVGACLWPRRQSLCNQVDQIVLLCAFGWKQWSEWCRSCIVKLHKEVLCIVCVVRCAKKCAASYISGSRMPRHKLWCAIMCSVMWL